MGFFGSDSKTKKTTKITTKTTTKMRDIGLTGGHAVDMAAILETGAIERSRITAGTFDNLIQAVGKTNQQLIGGASDLVRTQGEMAQGGSQMEKLAPWIAIAAIAVPIMFLKR